MSSLVKSIIPMFTAWLIAAASPQLYAHDAGAQRVRVLPGEIALELVGQVLNVPTSPISDQYGYLSSVTGIDSPFISSPHDETTARFTFSTAATTTQVINNGNLRIVDRTGMTTIYFNETPKGDFDSPSTFAAGTPILTMSLRQQVILNVVDKTFTTVNINRVTSASAFVVDGKESQLAEIGDQFRTAINGLANDTGTPAGFVIAGYAVPITDY